jgi:hypothetical protein
MKWFQECLTVNDIRALYRKLARQFHPDLPGGDQETMKMLNAAYEQALKSCHGQTSTGTDGKAHTYYYNDAIEKELMEKFSALLKLKMNGVTIEILGTWIWATGETRPHKEALKALGMIWHSGRVAWYWRKQGYRRTMADISMDDIRDLYGVRASGQHQANDIEAA